LSFELSFGLKLGLSFELSFGLKLGLSFGLSLGLRLGLSFGLRLEFRLCFDLESQPNLFNFVGFHPKDSNFGLNLSYLQGLG